MNKRKIYWFLQQLKNIGGTEVVTIQIMNMLSDIYDITLVVLAKKPDDIPYQINNNIKIVFFGFDQDSTQFDRYFGKYIDNKEINKALQLAIKTNYKFFYANNEIKEKILAMTTKDDILVVSSQELMLFMPKDRFIYRHFHYNSFLYHKPFNRLLLVNSRKPDYTIFLTEATQKELKFSNKYSTYISNPARYPSEEHYDYHNNNLLFVGRFEEQKNPMFLLRAIKILNKIYTNYNITLVGNGSLYGKMMKFIKANNLDNVKVVTNCTSPLDYYRHSDLLLMTSRYEGFALVALEAQSQSCPVFILDMNDPTKDIVHDGINGMIVYEKSPKIYAEKLKKLLENKDALIKMKKSAYEYSLDYQPDKIKDKWIKLFDSHNERLK